MSEDFTEKLPKNGNDNKVLTAIENLETHVTKIDNRLQSLEKKVDERLHDTRPIWHKLVADIGELQVGQTKLEVGQARLEDSQLAMREQMRELDSAMRSVNRDQIVINDVVRRIQLDFHSLDERLHRLLDNRNSQNSST